MIFECIDLVPDRNVTLTLYIHENKKEYLFGKRRPIIIICPGGGYSYLSDREADPIAAFFMSAGMHTAILRYGIGEYAVAPGPLHDIAASVAFLRDRADELFIDPDAVFVCGFSAGGHVAAQLGVFWNDAGKLPEYKDCPERIKPNGMILGYPVIDLKASAKKLDIGVDIKMDIDDIDFAQTHPGISKKDIFIRDENAGKYYVDFELAMNAYIFGGYYTEEQENEYCLQSFVSKDTPPAFIWHCAGDNLILTSNSLDFSAALAREGVDFELHIYSGGGHGLATSDYMTAGNPQDYYEASTDWHVKAVDWVNRISGYKDGILNCKGN